MAPTPVLINNEQKIGQNLSSTQESNENVLKMTFLLNL
jgi:hypothetical protein